MKASCLGICIYFILHCKQYAQCVLFIFYNFLIADNFTNKTYWWPSINMKLNGPSSTEFIEHRNHLCVFEGKIVNLMKMTGCQQGALLYSCLNMHCLLICFFLTFCQSVNSSAPLIVFSLSISLCVVCICAEFGLHLQSLFTVRFVFLPFGSGSIPLCGSECQLCEV